MTLLLAGLRGAPEALAAPPWASYTLTTFAEEFGGTALNPNIWGIYNNRDHLSVADGQLHLHTVALGSNWTSESNWVGGGIRTLLFQQKFGYFETRMQIGGADGLNNAFWLNTPPSSANDNDHLEIDITEMHFHGHSHMNVHDWKPVHQSMGTTLDGDFYPGFHTVGLEWAIDGTLRWYLDGAVVRTLSASSLNAYNSMLPLEVLLSTKAIPFAGTLSASLVGTHMDVDYVRVWQKPGWLGSGSGNWGTATNWGADGVPGAGEAAVFNGPSTNPTISLAADKPVKELYFCTANCAAYQFAAGNNLLLGELASGTGWGGINVNNDVTRPQVINTAIIAQSPLVFACYSTAPGVSLDLNGNLTSATSNQTLHVAGAGRVKVAGTISNQFQDLLRFNPGELWLTAPNAFTGLARVQNGTLVVTANGALGAVGGSAYTVVSSGASLVLAANVNYAATESVHLSGSGEFGRQGALDVLDDTSVALAGLITLDADATIGSGASGGRLTLAGTVNTSTQALTVRGNGVTVFNGSITGEGNLIKSGSGTVALNGAHLFLGGTTVQSGVLELGGSLDSSVRVDGGTLGLGATTGIRPVNGNLTLSAGGALRIRLNGTTAGSQYDQLSLTNEASAVVLNGQLDLSAAPGLAAGSAFRIIDNSANSAAVSGTFAGLPQNAEFYEDGQWWRINYSGGSGNDVVLTRIVPSAWQSWQAAHFGSLSNDPAVGGPAADVDADGMANFLEFALALDPHLPNPPPAKVVNQGAGLEFTYTRSKAALGAGVVFTVEWSDTLVAGSWGTAGIANQNPTPFYQDASVEKLTVLVPTAGLRRFVHLKVVSP